jgi:benzoyl-CoA reductase/2-hydroxyglutaryl-CoA dehydratase subunit BcrC/BadD/HgdB
MNMPETLKRFEEALDHRPGELVEARQNGKKVVGVFCCYTPVEIIHSLGLIPLKLGWGGDDELAEQGIEYITNIQCPYVRQTIGVFKEGKNPYAVNTDVIAISAVCLQEYRMVEVLRYYFGKETLTLSVPKNYYLPEGKEFFEKEVEGFTAELEKIAGRKLDPEQLRASVALYADIRNTTAKIYEYLARDHSPITWKQVITVIHAGFYLSPEKHLSLLKELNDELKTIQVSEKVRPLNSVRLLLSGSIIAPGNTKIIDVLEELGGHGCRR